MQAYRVDGSLRQGKTNQKFCIDIVAENEDDAREKIYSNFKYDDEILCEE